MNNSADLGGQVPTRFTWLPGDPSATSGYAISYEAELDRIFRIHPDWLVMLHALDPRSLMTDPRFYDILHDHHTRMVEERRQHRFWRWRIPRPVVAG